MGGEDRDRQTDRQTCSFNNAYACELYVWSCRFLEVSEKGGKISSMVNITPWMCVRGMELKLHAFLTWALVRGEINLKTQLHWKSAVLLCVCVILFSIYGNIFPYDVLHCSCTVYNWGHMSANTEVIRGTSVFRTRGSRSLFMYMYFVGRTVATCRLVVPY
jgi:hypothetical protein